MQGRDTRAAASEDWLQKVLDQPAKRGQPQLLAVEWTESKHPSKVKQKKPQETWDVVVRDFHGGEFCRKAYRESSKAEASLLELRKRLVVCNGNVLAALSEWIGHPVQVRDGQHHRAYRVAPVEAVHPDRSVREGRRRKPAHPD